MRTIEIDDNYKKILFEVPLFKDLNLHVKSELLNKLDYTLYHFDKDDLVAKQGELCNRLFILLKGKLNVNILDYYGNEVHIEYIVAPRPFATPHLFKEDSRLPATFKAEDESVLLTVTKDSTFELISQYPNVLKSFLCISGNCNVCTTVRLDVLSRKTVRDRLIVYFNKMTRPMSNIVITPSLTQLAEYLNVSRPALSTEFNRMEKEGLLKRIDKNHIEVNNKLSQFLI